jgi:tetratricopeptide (TPR) repeat protein
MRRARWIGLWYLLAILAGGLASSHALAQDLDEINREVSDLESDTQRLMANRVPAEDLKSETFVEERLTDGELYLRLGDYLRAAILFTDIVDHYQTHRAYPEALFLLGESLFSAGDYLGARKRYAEVIERSSDPAFSDYLQPSLSRLIEIAIHTRDFRGMDAYFARLEALPSSTLAVSTAYFRSKYLYNRAVPFGEVLDARPDASIRGIDQARLEQARLGFLAIPRSTAFSLRAQYFVGTIHTLRKEYLDAIGAFRGLLGQEPTNDEEREVIELTYLALGRLYYETEQLPQAVEAYRAVGQASARYDEALYELAWTYIRMGDAVQAERTLEVLSVAAPDSPLNADGKVLRGELLSRAGRYQEAEVVFDEVRETFVPIRNDLVRTRNEHPDLRAYFRQIVSENLDDFDIDDFLPPSARRWIDLEGDYQRALDVLSDLSESKQVVDETEELAERITAVLRAPNRVSVFSDLRRQRERTTALRNRAARLQGVLMESEARKLGDRGGELGQARARRRELQAAVMGMPVATEDFVARDMERLDQYRTAERNLQALQVEILGLEARIVASQSGLAVADPQKVDREALQAELADQQREARQYEDRLVEIRRGLEVGRLHVGVGDKRYQVDDRERSKFLDLVERERRLAGSAGVGYDAAHKRIAAVERLLDQRDSELQDIVQRRAARMLSVVDQETANLRRYRKALTALEGETVDVVGAIAYLNFNRIHDRFYELVLRADLGKVDLAWAKREEHRQRVDELTRERARQLQALDDEFRDVMDQGRSAEGGP